MNSKLSEESLESLKSVINELFYSDLLTKIEHWDTNIKSISGISNNITNVKRTNGEISDTTNYIKAVLDKELPLVQGLTESTENIQGQLNKELPNLFSLLEIEKELIATEFKEISGLIDSEQNEMSQKVESVERKIDFINTMISIIQKFVENEINKKLSSIELVQNKLNGQLENSLPTSIRGYFDNLKQNLEKEFKEITEKINSNEIKFQRFEEKHEQLALGERLNKLEVNIKGNELQINKSEARISLYSKWNITLMVIAIVLIVVNILK